MIVRFSFYTQKAISLYAQKCNELLERHLVHAIFHDAKGYYVEAQGSQQEITSLANLIGESFPLSCWLIDTSISAVDSFLGQKKPLKISSVVNAVPYCEQCKTILDSSCAVCGSQQASTITLNGTELKTVDDAVINDALTQFAHQGQLSFSIDNNTQDWLTLSKNNNDDQRLLFTDIKQLEQACFVTERDLQLLLSVEKPNLRLAIQSDFKQKYQLAYDSYVVSLPTNKLGYVLAQKALQQSIPAVVLRSNDDSPQILKYGTETLVHDHAPLPEPLITHEPVHKKMSAQGLKAQWSKGKLSITHDQNTNSLVKPEMSAAYALENCRQRDRFMKKCAVLFLDSAQPSGLLYRAPKEANNEYQWLFETPSYPQGLSLEQLFNDVVSNDPSSQFLIDSFKAANPDITSYAPTSTGSLTDMLGFLAVTLGLSDSKATLQQACNSAIATVISNRFETFPRIQFDLKTTDDMLLIDWAKAFQSVLSYRAAMPESNKVIVAGFLDSLADYLCNWIEKLDQHLGFEKITLAGDAFDNPVFLELLRLRLSKNVNLVHANDSDLTQMSMVFGALFVADNATFTR